MGVDVDVDVGVGVGVGGVSVIPQTPQRMLPTHVYSFNTFLDITCGGGEGFDT